MVEDEAELVSRCQRGDQDALREIFDRYHKKVYRIAYGVVRSREEALDVVQEVFIKLIRTIRNFKGESRLYTSLYRMAMNSAIDHARKMKRTSAILIEEEGLPLPALPEERPDRVLLRKELEGKVKEALEKLPKDQRMAILFREIEGLSYEEIAEAMGCSIGTVMSRLHYGRKRMQDMLKDYVQPGKRE